MSAGADLEPAMVRALAGRGTPADALRLARAIEAARGALRVELAARLFPDLTDLPPPRPRPRSP